jgi:hypothetical protein
VPARKDGERGMRLRRDEVDLAGLQRLIGLVGWRHEDQRRLKSLRAENPNSQAASTGKYEFEIKSGTAILIGIIRMLARAST